MGPARDTRSQHGALCASLKPSCRQKACRPSKPKMSPNGFEPLTFCVLGKRDNQLHQGDRHACLSVEMVKYLEVTNILGQGGDFFICFANSACLLEICTIQMSWACLVHEGANAWNILSTHYRYHLTLPPCFQPMLPAEHGKHGDCSGNVSGC